MKKIKGTRKSFAARLTEAEREQICDWSREGVSRAEIATRLGVCEATVTLVRKRYGMLQQPRKLDTKARREILKLHGQGLGSRRIAERTKFGRVTVMKVLKASRIKLKHGGPFLEKSKQEAIDAAILGRKDFICKIAKQFGVGTETVRRRAHKLLGPAKLLSVWPPLQTRFSQDDARKFLSPQDGFLELVLKCIGMTAQEFLQRGWNREEVMAARKALENDPSPVLAAFDAGLRRAAYAIVESMRLAETARNWTVH
jgi:transposase